MSIVFQLIAIFTNVWFIAFFVLVETIWAIYFVDALGNAFDRTDIKNWLKSKRGTRVYRENVGRWLSRIDRFLIAKNMADTPRPPGNWWRSIDWLTTPMAPSREVAESEARRAWSWPLFDFALRLALIYPLIALIATWAVTGGTGQIGELTVLEAEPSRLIRATAVGCIAAIFLFLYLSHWAGARNKRVYEHVYFGLAVAVTVAHMVVLSANVRRSHGLASYCIFVAVLLGLTQSSRVPLNTAMPVPSR